MEISNLSLCHTGSGTIWQSAQQRERTEGGQGEGAAKGAGEEGGH